MGETLLQVKDLRVSYDTYAGEVQSVRGVSFEVDAGETLAIVGESGCGKSVTAKSIMGLIMDPGQIKKGSQILFDGVNILDMTPKELRAYRGEKCAMIFQDALTSLDPTMKVGKQIAEVLRVHGRAGKAEAAAKAVELLRRVGIPNPEIRAQEYPHQFSGGMRQRAMIATALACDPRLLIADEPTTALDVTIQAQILRLMNDLQKENGTAIMFITHDLGVINEMADDVVVMYCGQVVEQAPARLIFTDCEKSHPYTEGLMYSIPRLNDERAKLDPIPGVVPHPLDLPQGCKFAPRCRYCTGKCIREEPELLQVAEGQLIRCFYPDKMERRSEKHGKNTVHGQREDH